MYELKEEVNTDQHGFGERWIDPKKMIKIKTYRPHEVKVEKVDDYYVAERKKSYAEAKAKNKPGPIDMNSLLK